VPSPLDRLIDRLRTRRQRGAPVPAGRPDGWTLLAAWGPCGFAPVAPGTVGTLGAVPLAWAVSRLEPVALGAFLLAFLALSIHAAGRAGRYWRVVDAPGIVIDEVLGYLVAVAFLPFTWRTALVAFLLFRLFDVVKPWPASALDRWKTGAGVVLDDVAAGLYAWGGLRLLLLAFPGAFT
jgi:phosphatidylglycerophosphatase A